MKKFFTPLFLVIVAISLSGCTVFKKSTSIYNTNLEVWGVFDDTQDYAQLFAEYKRINPFVSEVTYRKFPIEDYERELIDALAAGNGPDIFMIQNAQLLDYQNKVAPAPINIINEKRLRSTFVDVVADDFLIDTQVYGVPLSVDSLALYYNKDIFNAASITAPPATWSEFQRVVEKITEIDQFGNLVRTGAVMGTGKNINRAADLITLLFFQSGVNMSNENASTAQFSRFIQSGGESVNAGETALNFYTQFASPSRSTYTWNRRQHYSIDSFVEGNVGMMVNYSWHYNTIRRKNEKMRFAVAPVPQLNVDKPINVANYWGFVVAKNKLPMTNMSGKKPVSNEVRIHEAWELLSYLTMRHGSQFNLMHGYTKEVKKVPLAIDPAADYIARTGKPAARRDLIESQSSDPILAPFVEGNLIARDWRRKNPVAIDDVLVQMIESVNLGKQSVAQALRTAESRATQLMK